MLCLTFVQFKEFVLRMALTSLLNGAIDEISIPTSCPGLKPHTKIIVFSAAAICVTLAFKYRVSETLEIQRYFLIK
jgi:hypothetical protein